MVRFYKPAPKEVSPQHFELKIKDLDTRCRGVGQANGVTWFVEGALPGEEVVVRALELKKNIGIAQLMTVKKRSEERISATCPYSSKCGGCSLLHMGTSTEGKAKTASIKRLLQKITGLEAGEPDKVENSNPVHYRRVCRLSVAADRRNIELGFREAYGKKIVPVESCQALHPELSNLIPGLRKLVGQVSDFKLIGHIELVAADNGNVVLVRSINIFPECDRQLFRTFAEQEQVRFYILERHEMGREDLVRKEELTCLNPESFTGEEPYYTIDGLKIYFRPTDFIQVNSAINVAMLGTALDYLELKPEDEVLDLFCGLGNFTLPVAKRSAHVYGVEVVGGMVRKANDNAKANGITNAEFIVQDLEEEFERTLWAKSRVSKVLLDPGRQGASRVMPYLVRRNISHIVYVSCNPLSLARDLGVLVKAGYSLKKWSVFNMFPGTEHVETVVLLSRDKA